MPTGWEQLGNVLGGGIDREGAFNEGRLRTAQTENAMQQARNRQLESIALDTKNKAQARFEEEAIKAGVPDPGLAAAVALGDLGSNFAAYGQGALRNQEYAGRETLGDALAPPEEQMAAWQKVSGAVQSPYTVSGDVAYNRLEPDEGLVPTAIGESRIGANRALEMDRLQPPAPGGGGGRDGAPTGYEINPAFDPTKPVGEDNYKFIDARQPPNAQLGSVERRFITRIMGGAAQTIGDIEAFFSLPVSASVGVYGGSAGMRNEHRLVDALMYQAKYRMSSEEQNMYNAALGGFSEQLRVMEAQGVRGAASTAAQFDALRFESGDSDFTRLWKLARVRQTIENALEPNLANSALPKQEREYMRELIARTQKLIPFTSTDVSDFKRVQQKDPRITIGEMMEQRRTQGLGTPAPAGAAPAPRGAAPAGGVERWERGPDGKLRRAQ
jgi:hypothetical protein